MFVLGISGKRGVGKNYISDNYIIPKLIHKYSNSTSQVIPYYFSFGTPVKIELYSRDSTNTLDYNNLFINKNNETRKLLQQYATENGRDIYRKDMWIRAVDMWIQLHIDNLNNLNRLLEVKLVPLFIIQDIRFENEYNYVKKLNGLIVLVNAPKRNLLRIQQENDINQNHESEKGLEYLEFDLVILNETENSEFIERKIDEFIYSN